MPCRRPSGPMRPVHVRRRGRLKPVSCSRRSRPRRRFAARVASRSSADRIRQTSQPRPPCARTQDVGLPAARARHRHWSARGEDRVKTLPRRRTLRIDPTPRARRRPGIPRPTSRRGRSAPASPVVCLPRRPGLERASRIRAARPAPVCCQAPDLFSCVRGRSCISGAGYRTPHAAREGRARCEASVTRPRPTGREPRRLRIRQDCVWSSWCCALDHLTEGVGSGVRARRARVAPHTAMWIRGPSSNQPPKHPQLVAVSPNNRTDDTITPTAARMDPARIAPGLVRVRHIPTTMASSNAPTNREAKGPPSSDEDTALVGNSFANPATRKTATTVATAARPIQAVFTMLRSGGLP